MASFPNSSQNPTPATRGDFSDLVRCLEAAGLDIDPPYLHGLLTAVATVPCSDPSTLWLEIGGDSRLSESVQDAVIDVLAAIGEDLSVGEFQAHRSTGRVDASNHWIEGYVSAIALDQEAWEELSEEHTSAGQALIILHSLISPEIRLAIGLDQPGDDELRADPDLPHELAIAIYHHFHGLIESDADLLTGDLPPLPGFTTEELAGLDETGLFALVLSHDDLLPLEVVQECARREEAMVPILSQHLENAANWHSDVDDSDWWALLHAVFILGLIPGEASAQALLGAFGRINNDDHDDLKDWLAANWPALCRNKTDYTTDALRRVAEDRGIDWYARSQAIDCTMAAAMEQGPAALDTAIDWLAAMCGDESEGSEFRVFCGDALLDFPRERHRSVMERLVALQKPGSVVENAYGLDEIDYGFRQGDAPEWQRFDNPWQFYDPEEILRRQERWLQEAREEEMDLFDLDYSESVQTYVREHPKVGRNDPCPCGSNKKYKKCCAQTIH